ncbi:hypothetical protein ES703_42452 [subsurface metagenome]
MNPLAGNEVSVRSVNANFTWVAGHIVQGETDLAAVDVMETINAFEALERPAPPEVVPRTKSRALCPETKSE